MPHPHDTDEAGFFRAFLITLGLFFTVVCVVVWRDGGPVNEWPWWELVFFAGAAVVGIISILIGWLAPARTVEWWAGRVPTEEATIIIMVIAAPLCFLRRLLKRKRRPKRRGKR